jgi:predicted nucleic acid-binding protein
MLYVDANVLIGAFEGGPEGAALSRFLLTPTPRTHPLVSSEVTLSEVLTGPLRVGDSELTGWYRRLFDRNDIIRLVPIRRTVLERAAELRAVSAMRLPDALHVATAALEGCRVVLSQDKRLFLPTGLRQVDPFAGPVEQWDGDLA